MAAQQQLARISILGVGKMGAASARRLAGLGYDVRVWNRSPDKAEALAQTPSITVAATARDAVGHELLFLVCYKPLGKKC